MIVDTRSKKYMSLKREGNVFIRQNKRKAEYFKTEYQYRDLDGTEYNIYITKQGKAYILKETTGGNLNKVYLPKDVSEQILAEIKQVKPNIIVDN